jgi:DNA-binding NtrC family response regulator
VRLPDLSGFDLVGSLRRQHPTLPVIMVTDHSDLQDAMRAGRIGALAYLAKPFSSSDLRTACLSARLDPAFEPSNADFPGLVGTSMVMRNALRQVIALAPLSCVVLIRGETGTGKELIARAIHSLSKRPGPFVAANMAAFAPTLVDDALFGHERGAFTGADVSRAGLFEQASGGTVLLDEVGDLLPALQAKLLRVLDTHHVSRLGSTAERRCDARVVAATNVDLDAAQRLGTFRSDLFYRLQQSEILLPPLRNRDSDILLLVDHYVSKISREMGGRFLTVAPETSETLQAYRWPGNIRELESALRRAAMVAPGPTIERHHLPPEITLGFAPATMPLGSRPPGLSLNDAIRDAIGRLERHWIAEALTESGRNVGLAAKSLGIDPKTLYEKRRRHGL